MDLQFEGVKILVSIVTAGVITGINQLYYQFQFSAFESIFFISLACT